MITGTQKYNSKVNVVVEVLVWSQVLSVGLRLGITMTACGVMGVSDTLS